MRVDCVEIYSDTANAAVMRHPERHFPGILFQGDTLHSLCHTADELCRLLQDKSLDLDQVRDEAALLRDSLRSKLSQYVTTLAEHGMDVSFFEDPSPQA
jgi:hypothetical protein